MDATMSGVMVTELAELARTAAKELEDAPAEAILRWAAETFGDRLCVTSSMTDAVLPHLASRAKPGIDVLFLETGYHFTETLGTRDAVAAIYPVNVVNVRPQQTVAEQDATLRPRLYERNPDLCCRLRKVQPLNKALEPYLAWASGIRRDESDTRRTTRVVEWDARRRKIKVNPLARWTQEDVDNYIEEHGILVNPMVYDGYPSIGCAPCTRQVAAGDDPRSGRWAGQGKTECGIHQ
ncbi:MAG: phosphoadenylyl-sulfate reductase [Streptosporangiales bacterium]|nr:phosphoadenylyl-sulfate reductase [Streptosporangiales bacterium]